MHKKKKKKKKKANDALKSKDADRVTMFLYKLITRLGVAEIVMINQGSEFVNKVNQKLFELPNIISLSYSD